MRTLAAVPTEMSVVVVAHGMERELPRTLRSLSPAYQRGLDADDYEVIVVDNGSPVPVGEALLAGLPPGSRVLRVDPAPPSPARAANAGLAAARGDVVGLLIDGARIASPGLLRHALLASRAAATPVVATLAWHLGPQTHMEAGASGYDRDAEDRLLAACGWEEDGYRLFAVSALSGSSRRGWFGPLGESNALFLRRDHWERLGGMDEAFALPGGGLVNHDAYDRACREPGAQLVILLGEGTFHQIHGGAATSRRVTRDEAFADYAVLRGRSYEPPPSAGALYLGRMPPGALEAVRYSADWAIRARDAGSP